MLASSPARSEAARFLIVSVAGVILDLAVATVLARSVSIPLPLAAFIGFCVAGLFNYILHERWTFRTGHQALAQRGVLYVVCVGVALATRIAVVAILQRVFSLAAGQELLALVPAVGVSFVVNFLLSKYLVFKSAAGSSAVALSGSKEAPVIDSKNWQIPLHLSQVFGDKRHAHVLVIPVINEGERIRAQLRRIAAANVPVDVVVADGGSSDGSLDEAILVETDVRALLVKQGPGRLSAQLRMAYAWCLQQGYDGIITIDGNGKDNVEAVATFVAKLDQGYDYVQGSRYRSGGKAENTPLERTIGNRLIHAPLMTLAGRRWFTDTTNGFRGYSARYLLDPRVQPFRDLFMNYELLFYLTARAGQLGYRVIEVGVRRSYPVGQKTPTKIVGFRSKFDVFEQLIKTVIGHYHPDR